MLWTRTCLPHLDPICHLLTILGTSRKTANERHGPAQCHCQLMLLCMFPSQSFPFHNLRSRGRGGRLARAFVASLTRTPRPQFLGMASFGHVRMSRARHARYMCRMLGGRAPYLDVDRLPQCAIVSAPCSADEPEPDREPDRRPDRTSAARIGLDHLMGSEFGGDLGVARSTRPRTGCGRDPSIVRTKQRSRGRCSQL